MKRNNQYKVEGTIMIPVSTMVWAKSIADVSAIIESIPFEKWDKDMRGMLLADGTYIGIVQEGGNLFEPVMYQWFSGRVIKRRIEYQTQLWSDGTHNGTETTNNYLEDISIEWLQNGNYVPYCYKEYYFFFNPRTGNYEIEAEGNWETFYKLEAVVEFIDNVIYTNQAQYGTPKTHK